MNSLKREEDIIASWKGSLDKPLVSISCLAYNHEKYIESALNGFLIQETDFPFEILIHEDASTDRTADIIKEYEIKYPNIIKPIYQTENQGHKGIGTIDARFNYSRAKGKYIALCEGDDYWASSDKLNKQVSFMSMHQNCSIVFHRAKVDCYNSDLDINKEFSKSFGKTGLLGHSTLFLEGGTSAPTATLFFKKEIIKELPKFFSLSPVGDMPLKFLCSLHGEIGYIDEILSVRRIGTPGSWNVRTRLHDQKQNDYLNAMIAMLEEFNQYSSYRWKSEVEKKCASYARQINKIGISPRINIKSIFPNYYQSLTIKNKLKVTIKGILNK